MAAFLLSQNFGPRRDGMKPTLAVLHYTAMCDASSALQRLCDPVAEVSAHWLIGLDGKCISLVDEASRAWHAGAGRWGRATDVNSASIGIELDNDGTSPFPEAQMRALESLLSEVLERWTIPPEGVIGHSDLAPGRKADPGPRFDWRRLALSGLSIWPEARVEAPFADSAARFGYPVAEAGPDAVLRAFRLRFRPGAAGPEDAWDRALAADLARRFPVDRSRRKS